MTVGFMDNYAVYGDDQTRLDIDELEPYVGASLSDVARGNIRSSIISERSTALAVLEALSGPIIFESTEEQANIPLQMTCTI